MEGVRDGGSERVRKGRREGRRKRGWEGEKEHYSSSSHSQYTWIPSIPPLKITINITQSLSILKITTKHSSHCHYQCVSSISLLK